MPRFNPRPHSMSFNWNRLWNSKLHNRHKLLLWRIINDILLCKARLSCLFPIYDLNCALCISGIENVNHIFLNCPFIQQAWFISHWSFRIDAFSHLTVKSWISLLLDKANNLFNSDTIRSEFLVFTAALFDLIWINRNRFSHASPPYSVQEIVSRASRNAIDHWKSIITSSTGAGSSPNRKWTPPPPGWFKINTDASFVNGKASSSFIIKNSNGSILIAHTQNHDCHDALTAEALALLEACKFLHHFQIKEAIIESDSLNAISFIRSSAGLSHWTAEVVIQKIKRVWNLWPKWRFKFTHRNANRAAHSLASWDFLSKFSGIIPLNLIPVNCFCDLGFPIVDCSFPFCY